MEAQYATTIPMGATAKFNSELMQNCKAMQDSAQGLLRPIFADETTFGSVSERNGGERKLWATWAI
jgi:hypothetical protein